MSKAPVDDNTRRPNFGRGAFIPGAIDTSTELRHPTPSLDPGVIKSLDGYDGNEGYVEGAVSAFDTAQRAISDVINARDKLRASPALTEDGRLLRLADYATARQTAATQAMDSAMKRLESGIKSIEDSLNKPLQSAADNSVSAEIRAYFQRLSNEDRRTRILEAINAGDAKTVSAVLGTVPYLSGLDSAMQAIYTKQWNARVQPELTTRVGVMQRTLELVNQRGALVLAQIELAMGKGSWQRIARARELHNAAESAVKLA